MNALNEYDAKLVREAARDYMARTQTKSVDMNDPAFLAFLKIFNDAAQDDQYDPLDHPDRDPCGERQIELRNDAWAKDNLCREEEDMEREGMAEWDRQMDLLRRAEKDMEQP